MPKYPFSVVITESPTGDRDFQVRRVALPAAVQFGAAPLGRATVYLLSPVYATDARDARTHALTLIDEVGLRGTPTPTPTRRRRLT